MLATAAPMIISFAISQTVFQNPVYLACAIGDNLNCEIHSEY